MITKGGDAKKLDFIRGCILPSKFLLPEMILHTFSLFFSISFETLSSKGPEFPIQVVQPYPTILKPSLFKKT